MKTRLLFLLFLFLLIASGVSFARINDSLPNNIVEELKAKFWEQVRSNQTNDNNHQSFRNTYAITLSNEYQRNLFVNNGGVLWNEDMGSVENKLRDFNNAPNNDGTKYYVLVASIFRFSDVDERLNFDAPWDTYKNYKTANNGGTDGFTWKSKISEHDFFFKQLMPSILNDDQGRSPLQGKFIVHLVVSYYDFVGVKPYVRHRQGTFVSNDIYNNRSVYEMLGAGLKGANKTLNSADEQDSGDRAEWIENTIDLVSTIYRKVPVIDQLSSATDDTRKALVTKLLGNHEPISYKEFYEIIRLAIHRKYSEEEFYNKTKDLQQGRGFIAPWSFPSALRYVDSNISGPGDRAVVYMPVVNEKGLIGGKYSAMQGIPPSDSQYDYEIPDLDPLELIQLTYILDDGNKGKVEYMPAIALLLLGDQQYNRLVTESVEMGFVIMGAYEMTVARTTSQVVIASFDVLFPLATQVVFENKAALINAGHGDFVRNWEVANQMFAIYSVGRCLIALPQLFKSIKEGWPAARSKVNEADARNVDAILTKFDEAQNLVTQQGRWSNFIRVKGLSPAALAKMTAWPELLVRKLDDALESYPNLANEFAQQADLIDEFRVFASRWEGKYASKINFIDGKYSSAPEFQRMLDDQIPPLKSGSQPQSIQDLGRAFDQEYVTEAALAFETGDFTKLPHLEPYYVQGYNLVEGQVRVKSGFSGGVAVEVRPDVLLFRVNTTTNQMEAASAIWNECKIRPSSGATNNQATVFDLLNNGTIARNQLEFEVLSNRGGLTKGNLIGFQLVNQISIDNNVLRVITIY